MITFVDEVYIGLVADWRSHSRSANDQCKGESWKNPREFLGKWEPWMVCLCCSWA